MSAHACRDGDRTLGAPQAAPARGCRLLEFVFLHPLPLPHGRCPLIGSVSWRAGLCAQLTQAWMEITTTPCGQEG